MGSRRGRLNWSNLEVRISDDVIDKQHRFTAPISSSSISTLTEDIIEYEKEPSPISTPIKRSWKPKSGVGEIHAEQFVSNFMLTNAEQTAIDQRYKKQINNVKSSKISPTSKPIRISNRLPSVRDTVLSPRTINLFVGQHLSNVFVCHVESYSHVYIMFGDDYNRATKLFQDMNTCNELIQSSTNIFEPKEQDLVAIYHEKKWFRGRCLNSVGTNFNILCIDSGVIILCSPNNLRRLPDIFRTSPPCCIECSLSGLPTTIVMNSMPDAIHTECFELLYKDRYEAIVTKLESPNHPTIVLYYGDENRENSDTKRYRFSLFEHPKMQQLGPLLNPEIMSSYSQSLTNFQVFAIAIIVIGSALLTIGFLGCCGAVKGFRFLHVIYATVICLIIIAEITVVVVVIVYQGQFREELVPRLQNSIVTFYAGTPPYNSTSANSVSLSWDFAQFNLQCCGAASVNDFSNTTNWDRRNPYNESTLLAVPFTCCPLGAAKSWTQLPADLTPATTCATTGIGAYSQGCYDRLVDILLTYKKNVIIGCVIVGVIEILAVIFAIVLYRRKEDYASL
ncbi:unnamed protein product [Rotaria sordida]|uniref:Tudor domain-containing protein n=1 Tax=Rotaria sordida TaxID=392033 RepID=A0A815D2V7_9BILA|nr:unnamed protein product [Rotaria sordida]